MFYFPWYLILLVLLPAIGWLMFDRREQNALRFSSLQLATQLRPTLRQRLSWLPSALTLLAMLFTLVGLARPRAGTEKTINQSDGIAIEMVVDRSGSMQAMDFKIGDKHVDRLTAIKNVASKFVVGGNGLDGRFNDLVGLVTFAGYADSVTPPTLDHSFLLSQLQQTQMVSQRSEDGTAIGDAISLAVEKLHGLDTRQKAKVKSKVVILLTDGENNAGAMEPAPAAELAQTLGIKIYTIGVGTQGEAPVPVTDAFGRQHVQWMPVNIDEATLQKVAELTKGKYFRATDTNSLEKIYEEIDQLEKTDLEVQHYVDYRELAVSPFRLAGIDLPPLLLVAFMLLIARFGLEQTWLREFP